MAITIDWGSRVIFVPKSDLTLIQSSPTEIREMNLNWFRLQLKDLEDSEEGMVNLDTHNHNTAVTLGGLTYARIIEIINDYTVTFEDGQYAVNLVGANSNVGDRVNVNQVSVRSQNSAGLVQMREIEYSSFAGGVTIDTVNGTAGTAYPIGTPSNPVNNLADAQFISNLRGIPVLFVNGEITISSSESIDGYSIIGQGATFNQAKTTIILENGCTTSGTKFEKCKVSGRQNGETEYINCAIGEITNVHCSFNRCKLIGPVTVNNNTWTVNHTADLKDCFTIDWYIVDYNNSPINQVYANLSGKIKIINCTHPDANIVIQLDSGSVWIDSSCTNGNIEIKGIGNYTNESLGMNIDTTGLIGSKEIEYSSFGGRVTIDTVNGLSGTNYPIGTPISPVNNLADAISIAESRGFDTLFFNESIEIGLDDMGNPIIIDDYIIQGKSLLKTVVNVLSGSSCIDTEFESCLLTGTLDGGSTVRECLLNDIYYVNGYIYMSLF